MNWIFAARSRSDLSRHFLRHGLHKQMLRGAMRRFPHCWHSPARTNLFCRAFVLSSWTALCFSLHRWQQGPAAVAPQIRQRPSSSLRICQRHCLLRMSGNPSSIRIMAPLFPSFDRFFTVAALIFLFPVPYSLFPSLGYSFHSLPSSKRPAAFLPTRFIKISPGMAVSPPTRQLPSPSQNPRRVLSPL